MRFFWILFLCLLARAAAAERPNILFVLVDDLRWNALGFMGDGVVKTPNLDRLAGRSVVFRNAFVTTSICAVSRASVFSGQYARRHGIEDFGTAFSAERWAQTYPALLRAAGYRTGFIGKFGVGDAKAVAGMAEKFDYWRGLPGQGYVLNIDPKDPTRTHATTKMGNEAVEFLTSGSGEQPFCLSVSFQAVHARDGRPREFEPDGRDEELYAQVEMPLPKLATQEAWQRLPDFVRESEGRRRWKVRFATPEMAQRTVKDYYRLVTGVDREVGRMLEALAQRGLEQKTVVIFTSDNGFCLGDRGMADKWTMYEESLRVPMVVFDPRQTQEPRGRKEEVLALNIDVAPTILDFAGVKIPEAMQGVSLRQVLEGKRPGWREEFFYEHHSVPGKIPPSEGVRTARWKYLRWLRPAEPVEELYDLETDPLEERNLAKAAEQAEKLAELRRRWEHLSTALR